MLNPSGGFIGEIGSKGAGNGQFKEPVGLAVDAQGDVWVADEENNRIEEFSSTGTYLSQFGTSGAGNGQFNSPVGVAVSEGNVYVVDHSNHRVQQFNTSGMYLGQFGGNGSRAGQFKEPVGIATNPNNGDLYVSDSNNERVEEFSPAGKYLAEFGSYGSGKGQFHGVQGLAINATGVLYAVDAENARVEKWLAPGAGGAHMTYSTQFGSSGSGNGQFNSPRQAAIDGHGNVWVADDNNHRIQEFSPAGKFLAAYGSYGTGNGQFEQPTGIDINQGTGNLYVADCAQNRIQELSSTGTFIAAFGSAGTGNGQFQCPAGLKLDSSGDVWVIDSGNARVEEFSSTGTFKAAYGSKGTGNGQFEEPWGLTFSGANLYIADYANNRIQELSSTGSYLAQFGFAGDGGGEFKGPETIATDTAGNLYVVDNGNSRVQEFSAAGTFLGAFGSPGSSEGQLKDPEGIAINPAGDVYVADSNNSRIQEWAPVNQAAHDTKTIYYTAGSEAETTECRSHPEWVGLPCQSTPVAQPATSGLPELPTKTIAYNMWDQPEEIIEAFGSTKRTTKTEFDGAGRPLWTEESSSNDTPLSKITDTYNTSNGTQQEQSTTVSGATKTITSLYDKRGELERYTDASGATTKYTYDEDGRVVKITDPSDEGKGEQTYTYDKTSGELTQLVDVGAGTFTAAYDVQGKMTSESYPNGMTAYDTYSPSGAATAIEYKKLTHCTENCVWFKDTITPSIHGETISQTSTLAEEPSYTYDAAGRLTQAQEIPAGEGCATRTYAYNEDNDRTSLTASKPGSEGKCTTENGVAERHTYDSADRMTDEGITYEPFGNITTLPENDAGGAKLTTEYYLDSQIYRQTQNEETSEYKLDPEDRTLETITTGKTTGTMTSHYDGPGSTTSWTSEASGKWERKIPGIEGGLAANQTGTSTSAVTLQLHDLQGNIVATTADNNETETKLLTTYNSTEFGTPNSKGTPPKYSWLGAAGLTNEGHTTGLITQDGTTYVPQTGQPLQPPQNLAPGTPNSYSTPYTNNNTTPTWAIQLAATTAANATAKRHQEILERETANTPPGAIPSASCNEETEGCGPDPEHGKDTAGCGVWASWKHYLSNDLGVNAHFVCNYDVTIEIETALLLVESSGEYKMVRKGKHVEPFILSMVQYEYSAGGWECTPGATYQAWVYGRYWDSRGHTIWDASAEDQHYETCPGKLADAENPTDG